MSSNPAPASYHPATFGKLNRDRVWALRTYMHDNKVSRTALSAQVRRYGYAAISRWLSSPGTARATPIPDRAWAILCESIPELEGLYEKAKGMPLNSRNR